jgi:hypothetical protein
MDAAALTVNTTTTATRPHFVLRMSLTVATDDPRPSAR